MAINIAYHGMFLARGGEGHLAPAVGKPVSAPTDVADGAASSALATEGWVRIAASTDSLVAFGSAVTNGTNGEYFPQGAVEFRYLKAGDKIGVSAA